MLPGLLEKAEAELEQLTEETGAADFYTKDHALVTEKLAALEATEQQVEVLMDRWVELEAMQ